MKDKDFKLDGPTIKRILMNNSIFVVLAILIAGFAITQPLFLSSANITNFSSQISSVGIITIAITMILITGLVDLSIASVAAFAGTLAVVLAAGGAPPIVVIPVALLSGAFWGVVNGFLITRFKLQPFILTLGTNYVIRGLLLFATNGIFVSGMPDWFHSISNTRLPGGLISTNALVFIILIIIFAYVMKNTRFGRYCYAVGANTEAARLSGINTDLHIIKVYALEGVVASIAGILLMSNLNVGAPSEGMGLDLFALAGAIMGGTRFGGGVGTIGGAIAGIFTIQVFQNGLSLMGVNSFMQDVVTGIIIVLAIVIDFIRTKSK